MSGLEELLREELIALAHGQAAVIAQLREANAALEQRVGRLERQVSRSSGNSSFPSSMDDLPGRVKPAPKRAKNSGRQRGKQKGTRGNSMPWVAVADERVPHRPRGQGGCGARLTDADDVRVERSHQVHDLPVVRIMVSQHDVYRVRCGCGVEHVGQLPDEVSTAPSSYGPNLKSLAVYLLVFRFSAACS